MKYIILLIFTIFFIGCAQQKSAIENTIHYSKIVLEGSKAATDIVKDKVPQEDYLVGVELAKNIINKEIYPSTHKRSIYLNKMVQVLKQHSKKPYIYNDYKVLLLKDNSFNAYALPGGIIIVNDGVLQKVYNEDQLAAILAHEIGHIENEHFLEDNKVNNYHKVAKFGLTQKIRDDDMENTKMAKKMEGFLLSITNKILDGYSVEQEAQADETAIRLLKDVGYETKALTDVLNKLKKTSNSYGGGNYPKDRIELIIENEKYAENFLDEKSMKIREKRFDIYKYQRY